jgi:hypothetical protein
VRLVPFKKTVLLGTAAYTFDRDGDSRCGDETRGRVRMLQSSGMLRQYFGNASALSSCALLTYDLQGRFVRPSFL